MTLRSVAVAREPACACRDAFRACRRPATRHSVRGTRVSSRGVGARNRAVAAPEERTGPPVQNGRVPLLQVGALDRAVEVERRLLDAFVELQIQGSGVDGLLAGGARQ